MILTIKTKNFMFFISLFCCFIKLHVSSPIRNFPEEERNFGDYVDSDYYEEYDYESENVQDNSTYLCPGQHLTVNRDYLCDGFPDCNDGSDEDKELCQEYGVEIRNVSVPSLSVDPEAYESSEEVLDSCSSSEFRCPSETDLCIPQHAVCDGVGDCPEGEDELFCDFQNLEENKQTKTDSDSIYAESRGGAENQSESNISSGNFKLQHNSSNMMFRLINHKYLKTKIINQDHQSRFRNPGSTFFESTSINPSLSVSTPTLLYFASASPVLLKHETNLGLKWKNAEWKTIQRISTPTKSENPPAGESGETLAADYFTHLDQMTNGEAESLLRRYESFTSAEREDENVRSLPINLRSRNGYSGAKSDSNMELFDNNQVNANKNANIYKKKVKSSLNRLIYRLGKLVSANSAFDYSNLNIRVKINKQTNRNNGRQSKAKFLEKTPEIKLRIEINL